ncbi:MAG: putative manganese transporter [Christensenellales bacterium]
MEEIWHVFTHAFLDTVQTLPLLYLAYLLVEYIERHATKRLVRALTKHKGLGVPLGALAGSIPQCGLPVAAAKLYANRVITSGTLIALLLSVSDEAVPMLIAQQRYDTLLPLLISKFIIGVLGGLIATVFSRGRQTHVQQAAAGPHEDHTDHHIHNIFLCALKHTLLMFLFIWGASILIGLIIHFVGEDQIASLLLNGSGFQPLITGLFGFIPSCAASVLLTELYISGSLSFGAMLGGLCTATGVGILVLFRANKNILQNIKIMVFLYGIGVLAGIAADWIF